MQTVTHRTVRIVWIGIAVSIFQAGLCPAQEGWDIAPFGSLRSWSEKSGAMGEEIADRNGISAPQSAPNQWNAGLLFEEARDVERVEIEYAENITEELARRTEIQYWLSNWPETTPQMPSTEDDEGDYWNGFWVAIPADWTLTGKNAIYRFRTMTKEENPFTERLAPPIQYRRALKFRLLYSQNPPPIQSLRLISPGRSKEVVFRVELGCNSSPKPEQTGTLEVWNGYLKKLTGWQNAPGDEIQNDGRWSLSQSDKPRGLIAVIHAADPALPGSHDVTIVTLRSDAGTFSFLVDDLTKGPIYIPSASACITSETDAARLDGSLSKQGLTTRQKIAFEPEQTFARARAEIPELNPTERQKTKDPLRMIVALPLCAEASWQKFAFQWGGNFFLQKEWIQPHGWQKDRLPWKGDVLLWQIGTGEHPEYQRPWKHCRMSLLENWLPILRAEWSRDGILYQEEAFATLLEGPLSPRDPRRDERTSAVLMVRLRASNPAAEARVAHLWARLSGPVDLYGDGTLILESIEGIDFIRGHAKMPSQTFWASSPQQEGNTFHQALTVPPNDSLEVILAIPFLGDLTPNTAPKLQALDYQTERNRVISYWRNTCSGKSLWSVPDERCNELLRAVETKIRLTAIKCPQTGLYMLPAGSFRYLVYGNETVFQTNFLDRMGLHALSESYLNTFLSLQGTYPMAGTFSGDQKDVFHGARVSDEFNYSSSGKYNLDHGTVLWGLARHYLLSRDDPWLRKAADPMRRACDWITEQRKQTQITDSRGQRPLYYGLLPAGKLEDNTEWDFWYAINAYAWLGMETAAKAFACADLPDAGRLADEARQYKQDILASLHHAVERAPVVRLQDNTYVPFVPSRVFQRFRALGPMRSDYFDRYQVSDEKGQWIRPAFRMSATREMLYGPMILLSTRIVPSDSPIAEWILNDWEDNLTLSSSLGLNTHGWVDDEFWFSRGGMVFQPNLQNPIESYLLRGEIPAAIRSLYNSMVSCLHEDVNTLTEEYRLWEHGSGYFFKTPDECRLLHRIADLLVMENDSELWLGRGIPRRWLSQGKKIELNDAKTEFGTVSYVMESKTNPLSIVITLKTRFQNKPDHLRFFVHAPQEQPIAVVLIDNQEWNQWNSAGEEITLPTDRQSMQISIQYEPSPSKQ